VGEIRRVARVLRGRLPADAADRVVEEDPPADVEQHRALRVALHVAARRLLGRLDADPSQELIEVVPAQDHDSRRDDDHDPAEPPPAPAPSPARWRIEMPLRSRTRTAASTAARRAPIAPALEPDRTRPMPPATPATIGNTRPNGHDRPSAIAARARASDAPE